MDVLAYKNSEKNQTENCVPFTGTESKSTWCLTDDDSFQIRRKKGNGIFELYEIEQILPYEQGGERRFKVAHEIIFISEIETDSVLSCYGYESLEELKVLYGDDWEGILAECEFKLSAGSGEGILRSPVLTWEENRSLICLLSGYTEYEPDQFMLFMSRKKLHSTVRFRFQYLAAENTVQVTDTCNGQDYLLNSEDALQDLISEKEYPLRMCSACGAPMQEGWTDEEGSTYFCSENEFRKDMDARYGRENWRPEPSGKKEWLFEYRTDASSSWCPEPSFYTDWEA